MEPKVRSNPTVTRGRGKYIDLNDRGPAPAESDAGGLRICILDWNGEDLEYLRRSLVGTGYEVLALDQVIGASNRIRQFQPDVLVVNVKMPSISGIKLVQVLRRNIIAMPALVLYADMDEDELAEIARMAAAHDFLVTDLGLDALVAGIRRCGERTKKPTKLKTT